MSLSIQERKQMKVLIVDDFPTMRRIVRTLLRDLGFDNVEDAEDGKQAFALLNTQGKIFNMIVSDWNMPNMTGLELLMAVRSSPNPNIKSLPFLMVTAEAEKENIIAAVKAGVSNYIVKPFNKNALNEKLDKIFASKK